MGGNNLKILWVILIGILFLYASIELTRVVWDWWQHYGGVKFLLEIVFIWVTYLIGMVLVYKRIK